MLRYRHLELTEIEIDDARMLPGVASEGCASSVLAAIGGAVLFVVRVTVFTLGLTVRIVLPTLGELVCIALAAVGLVGRGLDYVGCAAARRSWLIAASVDALAQLPPRRVERSNRTAITVRAVR